MAGGSRRCRDEEDDIFSGGRDMLGHMQGVRGMGRGLSDHYVILCKVRLVSAWVKRREVVVGVRT